LSVVVVIRCHLILPWQQLQGILLSTCMCMWTAGERSMHQKEPGSRRPSAAVSVDFAAWVHCRRKPASPEASRRPAERIPSVCTSSSFHHPRNASPAWSRSTYPRPSDTFVLCQLLFVSIGEHTVIFSYLWSTALLFLSRWIHASIPASIVPAVLDTVADLCFYNRHRKPSGTTWSPAVKSMFEERYTKKVTFWYRSKSHASFILALAGDDIMMASCLCGN
jgi:hypothetical protein